MDRIKNGVSSVVRRSFRYSQRPRLWWLRFILKVWLNFYKSGGTQICSSLAYNLLLAFIPFTVSIASLSSWLPVSQQIVHDVECFFLEKFIPQTGSSVYHLVMLSFKHTAHISSLGLLSLIITSYGMMFTLESHLNQMWQTKRVRSWPFSCLMYTGFFIIGPSLVYGLAYIVSFIDNLLTDPQQMAQVGFAAAYLVTFFSFIAIYRYLPTHKVSLRHAVYAGSLAAVLFVILQIYFSRSLNYMQEQYSMLYGSLAMLPIFLLWLYLSVLILLLGAQAIYVFERDLLRKKMRQRA